MKTNPPMTVDVFQHFVATGGLLLPSARLAWYSLLKQQERAGIVSILPAVILEHVSIAFQDLKRHYR